MATYKGIGFDQTSARTRLGTSADIIEFDAQIKGDDGLTVTGNSSITGNLTVSGTLFSQDEEQVLIKDNFIDLNFGNVSTSYGQAGLTINFQATANGVSINTTSNNVNFTAGTSSARAKLVADTASGVPADTFAAGDLIQISGTTNGDNDGLYVVQTNGVAGTVEILSSTLSSPDTINAKFALSNFTTEEETAATALNIRKVNLLALRSSSTGDLEQAAGNVDTDFQNADYKSVGSDTPLQDAYTAGNTITTAGTNPVSITMASDNAGFSLQGNSAGDGNVSIGGTNAVSEFIVNASGAASSITSTGQNLTVATATSGTLTLTSAGVANLESDDSMTIKMDADANSAKSVLIQANNTNVGGSATAVVALDGDDGVQLQFGGATKVNVENATSSFSNTIQADTTAGLKFGGSGTQVIGIRDQDDMAQNANNELATQQSIKAYVDSRGNSDFGTTLKMTADATGLAARDVVAILTTGANAGKATKADASALSTGNVLGVAIAAIGGGAVGTVAQSGTLAGFSGLVAGSRLYLSETAGAITATAPTTANSVVVQVGYALDASTIVIAPQFLNVNG